MTPHWKICGYRHVVSSLTQITFTSTMWRFWLRLKVAESSVHLLLFCVSAGTKSLLNGSPKKVRFLLWTEVHNRRSRYVTNNCNHCKDGRCYLCWMDLDAKSRPSSMIFHVLCPFQSPFIWLRTNTRCCCRLAQSDWQFLVETVF